MPSATIIGAGISGLACALELKKAGWRVHVLETSDRIGGAIQTYHTDGYLIEAGPNTLMVNTRQTWDFLQDIGLCDTIVEPGAAGNKRYIVKNRQLVAAPMGPLQALTTPLFSWSGKLRVIGDLFTRRPEGLVEESVAAFVRRRVGHEFLDYAINPFVGGIYAGDPEYLSLEYAFPKMAALERTHGSLIAGAIAKMRAKKAAAKAGEPAFKNRMLSFKQGMQTLPKALAAQLGDSIHTDIALTSIQKNSSHWSVTYKSQDRGKHLDCEHLILATPAHTLSTLPLPGKLRDRLSLLANIKHPAVTTLYLGFSREQIGHALDGFGVLIPKVEKRNVLGALFSTSLFPGRAPDGHVGLTVFIGGTRNPELATLSHDDHVQLACNELKGLVGLRGEPKFVKRTVWAKAIPQYELGYGEIIKSIQKAEADFSKLHLIGNYREGISVTQCLENARALAVKLEHSAFS